MEGQPKTDQFHCNIIPVDFEMNSGLKMRLDVIFRAIVYKDSTFKRWLKDLNILLWGSYAIPWTYDEDFVWTMALYAYIKIDERVGEKGHIVIFTIHKRKTMSFTIRPGLSNVFSRVLSWDNISLKTIFQWNICHLKCFYRRIKDSKNLLDSRSIKP